MHRLSRTLCAAPTAGWNSKTMISKCRQRAVPAAALRLPAASKKYFYFNVCSFTFLSYLILLLLCVGAHANDEISTDALDTVVGPYTAAVASVPGGSSIIDQFMPNCTKVAPVFTARGIDQAELPLKPNNGECLHYKLVLDSLQLSKNPNNRHISAVDLVSRRIIIKFWSKLHNDITFFEHLMHKRFHRIRVIYCTIIATGG